MKYIAKDECCLYGKVGPFDKARLDGATDKLYAQCNECKVHTCRIEVKEPK